MPVRASAELVSLFETTPDQAAPGGELEEAESAVDSATHVVRGSRRTLPRALPFLIVAGACSALLAFWLSGRGTSAGVGNGELPADRDEALRDSSALDDEIAPHLAPIPTPAQRAQADPATAERPPAATTATDPRLAALLQDLQTSKSWAKRARAARAIGQAGASSQAVSQALAQALVSDPDWAVQAAAAEALGELGSEVAALENALQTAEEPAVREAVKLALTRLKTPR